MHSIRTRITSLTLAAVLISVISFGFIGLYFVTIESNRTSEQTLNLVCENRKDALDEYLNSIEQSVGMISRYSREMLDSVALTEGGVLGASGNEAAGMSGRSGEQRSRLDGYFDEHLAFIEEAFKSVANRTNGAAAYYYRINPEITGEEKGFFYAKKGTSDFMKAELTDITKYDKSDTEHVGWYFIPIEQGRPSWVGPYYSDIMEDTVISYVIPVYKAGTFIGVLGMDIKYDTLAAQIQQPSAFKTGYFVLTDANGDILYHPEYEMGTRLADAFPQLTYVTEDMGQGNSSEQLIHYNKNGSKWQFTFTTLDNGMKLAAIVQESEINSAQHRLANVFLVTGLVIIICFIFITSALAKHMTDPMVRLTSAAKRLADGDYNVRLDYEGNDEAGVLTGTFRFMRDRIKQQINDLNGQLDELHRLQEALSDALSEAEEANKAKTAFLSNMSHEIRTPMNAIIGLDELALRDDALSGQTRGYLEKIGGSAKHLLDLINGVLDMSRIESGHMVLRREEFSFSAMLEQINTMVSSQCSEKGLSFECRVLSRVDDFYIGDDIKLKEVLINILSNAIKFTDAPGSVGFTIERTAVTEEHSTLRFCVKDTGIGMDEDYIPKIFDSFSQEDSSRKNKYGSTGLGMAITKNVVEMMNGSIEVSSQKGVGTEFKVMVTLRNSEKKDSAHENAVDPKTLKVLVVDDDAIDVERTRVVLDDVGIMTDVSTDGPGTLDMLKVAHTKQEPYNLVLLDWKMPEMDGLQVAEKIRELYSNETTVVIMTAYNWDDIQEAARKAGIDGFLAKPVFAANVIEEFERIARRNHVGVFQEIKLAPLAGRRVLLAEDTEINAELMMEVLSMEDINTDHAENGRVAVEMFEKSDLGTYSAILMDVRMPEMDGLEAAEVIRAMEREDAKRIPIIALTANAFDEDVQRSMQAGMSAHLSKPVDLDLLFSTLGKLIYEAETETGHTVP